MKIAFTSVNLCSPSIPPPRPTPVCALGFARLDGQTHHKRDVGCSER